MITLASQQGTPWSGFNGFGGGFGQVGTGWTLAATGVWTAPDGTTGWARNADGTYTSSVVDGLGNVIVYRVTEAMVPVGTVTVPPGSELVDSGDWWTRLSDVAGNLLRVFGLGTPTSTTTPVPAGGSLLNPGTWSLPMMLLIGGGVYWLVSSSGKRSQSRTRRNPRRRSQARVILRHLSAKEEMARYSPAQIQRALIRFGVTPAAARSAVARDFRG